MRAAEQRVALVRAEADQVRLQADQELADASQAVEELSAQVDDLRIAVDAERAKLASAGEATQRQAVELATVRERLTSAELAAQQAAEAHRAELAQARAALDQVREDLTRQLTVQTAQVRARDQQFADVREQHQAAREAAANEVLTHANGRFRSRLTRPRSQIGPCGPSPDGGSVPQQAGVVPERIAHP